MIMQNDQKKKAFLCEGIFVLCFILNFEYMSER